MGNGEWEMGSEVGKYSGLSTRLDIKQRSLVPSPCYLVPILHSLLSISYFLFPISSVLGKQ